MPPSLSLGEIPNFGDSHHNLEITAEWNSIPPVRNFEVMVTVTEIKKPGRSPGP